MMLEWCFLSFGLLVGDFKFLGFVIFIMLIFFVVSFIVYEKFRLFLYLFIILGLSLIVMCVLCFVFEFFIGIVLFIVVFI